MKKFYVIQDHTRISIWDQLMRLLPTLSSKPHGYEKASVLPIGEWAVGLGFYSMGTDGAYVKAGIWKPQLEQLPVIFCVNNNVPEWQLNVTEHQALEFIRARI